MRIYKPENEFGQSLLSTADIVSSTKQMTKTVNGGKVTISAAELGTEKASDWTVVEVIYDGKKMMADVSTTDAEVVVVFDDGATLDGKDASVTLAFEGALNVTEDAQQPSVIVQGAIIRYDDEGNKILDGKITGNFASIYAFGPNADFSELVDGTSLFQDAVFTSFDAALPALTKGNKMFQYSTTLTTFTGDMPSLTNGTYMFDYCSGLTSFEGDLSSLTDGSFMFSSCSKLTSFKGDLPALTNGYHMFENCNLDEASILRILNTVPTYTAGGYHYLNLGKYTNFRNSTDVASKLGVTTPIAATSSLKYKGWTITITA